jgi:hypothetical protein
MKQSAGARDSAAVGYGPIINGLQFGNIHLDKIRQGQIGFVEWMKPVISSPVLAIPQGKAMVINMDYTSEIPAKGSQVRQFHISAGNEIEDDGIDIAADVFECEWWSNSRIPFFSGAVAIINKTINNIGHIRKFHQRKIKSGYVTEGSPNHPLDISSNLAYRLYRATLHNGA